MMDREDQEWANLHEDDIVAEPDDPAAEDQLAEEGPPPDFPMDVTNPSGEVKATTDENERFIDLFSLEIVLMLASAHSTLLREVFPKLIRSDIRCTICQGR